MQQENRLPVYEVEELTFEEAVLQMASEQEKHQANYSASSKRLLNSMPETTRLNLPN